MLLLLLGFVAKRNAHMTSRSNCTLIISIRNCQPIEVDQGVGAAASSYSNAAEELSGSTQTASSANTEASTSSNQLSQVQTTKESEGKWMVVRIGRIQLQLPASPRWWS